MAKKQQNRAEVFPGFYVDVPPKARGIRGLVHRWGQLSQVLFSRSFSSVAEIYRSTADRYDQAEDLEYYRRLADYGWLEDERKWFNGVRSRLPPTAQALVVGCGAGREVFALEKEGYVATGTDISTQMIEAANELRGQYSSGARFFAGDFRTTLPVEAKFDLIWLTTTLLNHIPGEKNREGILRAAGARLRPGGMIIASADIAVMKNPFRLKLGSWLLWLRARGGSGWEKGDTVKSNLGPFTDTNQLIFFHYYPTEEALTREFRQAGFRYQKQNHAWILTRED